MELETVKIRKEYVQLVRDNKKKTRMPIAAFIESVIEKELGEPKKKQSKK